MKFTGERYVLSEKGRIFLEHYHRYAVMFDAVRGKDVLDIASGEGYGSYMLAKFANSVTGVDISNEAVVHANKKYQMKNLRFMEGNAAQLGFPDKSFDIVVSFETIEHLLQQDEAIAEFARVLRVDGVLALSSPNRPIYQKEFSKLNQFHVKELDFFELDILLKKKFQFVEYFGQQLQISSIVAPISRYSDLRTYQGFIEDELMIKPEITSLEDPVYFMAFCSNLKTTKKYVAPSIFLQEKIDLLREYMQYAEWAKKVDLEIIDRKYEIEMLKKELDMFRKESNYLKKIQAIKDKLFKLRLLREVSAWINNPKSQTRRYFNALIRLLRYFYRRYSNVISTVERHKTWFWNFFILNLKYYNNLRAVDFSKITSKNPVVSVVIPIFGNIRFTMNCLNSIMEHPPEVAFEIIVIDDCSLDESVKVLGQIKGISICSNQINQGFIKSCNAGALTSKGEYICFLNNDTLVTKGWLDSLYRTFQDLPGTGFVGSKLIYPNGKLQEAGGIIWRDGSAWNFGRNQNADLPIFNYAREVDYCSGASVMVPRKIFNDLGGFDELYSPAYCEDSDLALKIRRNGFRVIYQPLSVVIHFEGISSGVDITQGVKAYQVENTKKLYQRWKEHLLKHQPSGINVDDAKDRSFSKRVLVVDHCIPTPNQDAGSVTTFNTLVLLREMGFQVTFAPEENFYMHKPYTEDLQRIGIEVLYAPYVKSLKEHLQEFGYRYDLVFLFRPMVVERHIEAIRNYCKKAKVIFHTIDLHFLRLSREAAIKEDLVAKIAAEEMNLRELKAIKGVDATIVHSTAELEILKLLLPYSPIYVFPLILNVRGYQSNFKSRKDLLFVGGFRHSPNIDAINYFVNEVFPHIQRSIPGIRIYIVGSNPPPEILNYDSEYIKVLGFVEDLDPILDKVRLSVAPLRYGAGVKGKIGTSIASGLPVVASSIAIEGMSLSYGENIIFADMPEEFANQVIKIYNNEDLWSQLSLNGVEFATRTWGKDTSMSILSSILKELDINSQPRGYPFDLYH